MNTATDTISRYRQVELAKDYMANVMKEAARGETVSGTPERAALIAEYLDARAAIEAAFAYAQHKTDVAPFS